ncbi:MAG: arginase family protein [Haliscomenobacter sp.]|nr:arginase family protein [Haliscomenobacter sp.]MBK9489626.1 arginase family protein [Haliscomenobacter sp.]HPH20108.1 arginase family protein [Haliscomenobacter sp.]
MLDNWLSPIAHNALALPNLEEDHLAKCIQIHTEGNFPDLHGIQIALIALNEKEGLALRKALYPLSFPFEGLHIADLGTIRKCSPEFIMPVLIELHESDILPIIIGSDPALLQIQYKGLQHEVQHINMVAIDELIRLSVPAEDKSPDLFNEIVFQEKSKLFHLGIIGCQTHFTLPSTYRLMEELHFDYIRLGTARASLAEVEPIIRDADLLSFQMAALKQCEAPGQENPSPSGFNVEEACQLSRYAGMSEKVKSFGIFGYKASLDRKAQTANVLAQMIWYFLDGLNNRKGDFPVTTEGLTEYIVELKTLDFTVTFWKSQRSGRWWLQVPVKTAKKHQRHRLIPCSYNDYKMASQDELPDRLVNAFKRFL